MSSSGSASGSYPFPIPQPVSGTRAKAESRPWVPSSWHTDPEWIHAVDRGRPPPRFPQTPPPTTVHIDMPTPGVPPPPHYCAGDPERIALHAARFTRDTDLGFRPERFCTMISGRPVFLLVQTHGEAPIWEWYNVIGESLKPLQPICLTGVTGGGPDAPGITPHFSCANWWKASLFPPSLTPS